MKTARSPWNAVHAEKSTDQSTSSQLLSTPSIDWILKVIPDRQAAIIYVGAGTSFLVDHLLDHGYVKPSILDVSDVAIEQCQMRLGPRADNVEWILSDLFDYNPQKRFSL